MRAPRLSVAGAAAAMRLPRCYWKRQRGTWTSSHARTVPRPRALGPIADRCWSNPSRASQLTLASRAPRPETCSPSTGNPAFTEGPSTLQPNLREPQPARLSEVMNKMMLQVVCMLSVALTSTRSGLGLPRAQLYVSCNDPRPVVSGEIDDLDPVYGSPSTWPIQPLRGSHPVRPLCDQSVTLSAPECACEQGKRLPPPSIGTHEAEAALKHCGHRHAGCKEAQNRMPLRGSCLLA